MKLLHRHNEQIEEIERKIQEFQNHPLIEQILAEKAAETLIMRTRAANEIEILSRERDEIITLLQADLAKKETKYNKLKAAFNTATHEYQAARAEVWSKGHSFDSRIDKQKTILLDSCDERITEGIEFFNKKLDYLRSPGRISHVSVGAEKDIFRWTKNVKEESNRGSVLAALNYCRHAIEQLQEMKLSPSLDIESLERLKVGIPPIDVYKQHEHKAPLPKGH